MNALHGAHPSAQVTEESVVRIMCAALTAKRSRKRVASVREYVASKPKESRASLEAVRRAILKALPNAQEGLAYQMPAYTLNGVGVLYNERCNYATPSAVVIT